MHRGIGTLLLFVLAATTSAATRRNDDSCDIAVAPAATLLMPYFEVDYENPDGQTTIFAITNAGDVAQVARVTLWTDYAYPVLAFNVYLTGYDVQAINLRDVLNGKIGGSRFGTGSQVSPNGEHSSPNFDLEDDRCGRLPNTLTAAEVDRLQLAFVEGRVLAWPGRFACNTIGNVHENAVGYATIDVVGNCGTATPIDPEYFTEDLRYDNVLIGEYYQVDSWLDYAQGNPMAHIRAIPEGGTPSTRAALPRKYATNLTRTFYGRFQDPAHPHADARQPLPSLFAARWINGGTGSFQTSFKIWREGVTKPSATCSEYARNGGATLADAVVYDEDENGEGFPGQEIICTCPFYDEPYRPSTSLTSIADSDVFPQDIVDSEIAGWVYLNLDDDNQSNGALQGWVVISMRAEGRYSTDFDAAVLGNGCSPPIPRSEYSDGGHLDVLPGPAPDRIP